MWKEIAAGVFRHHKNTVSMKMRKKNEDYYTDDLKMQKFSRIIFQNSINITITKKPNMMK